MGPNRPGRALSVSVLAAVLLFAPLAWAGRLHPDLEAQLAALPSGGTVSVIWRTPRGSHASGASSSLGSRAASRGPTSTGWSDLDGQ